MQRRNGYIFPRIVEEVVDFAELQKVWNCGYLTANRIMHGRKPPNHIQKKQLSEYLGVPVEELFVRVDEDGNVVLPKRSEEAAFDPSTEDNSEISSESEEEV